MVQVFLDWIRSRTHVREGTMMGSFPRGHARRERIYRKYYRWRLIRLESPCVIMMITLLQKASLFPRAPRVRGLRVSYPCSDYMHPFNVSIVSRATQHHNRRENNWRGPFVTTPNIPHTDMIAVCLENHALLVTVLSRRREGIKPLVVRRITTKTSSTKC